MEKEVHIEKIVEKIVVSKYAICGWWSYKGNTFVLCKKYGFNSHSPPP